MEGRGSAGSPIPRASESKQSLFSPTLDYGESARKVLLSDLVPVGRALPCEFLEGGAVSCDGFLQARGAALALPQRLKRGAQVHLGHGPVERTLCARHKD